MRQKQVRLTKAQRKFRYWPLIPATVVVLLVGILVIKFTAPQNGQQLNSEPVVSTSSTSSAAISISSTATTTTTITTTSSASTQTSSSSSKPASVSSSSSGRQTLNCSNCWLASVDKTHALPSSYAPAVVPTELPGGSNWKITTATRTALKELFAAALNNGIEAEVISAYRSYKDQETAFNYWVNQEIAAGYDRATAIERANVYSAKPGHSEHQLGTTVDLKVKNNEAFTDTPANLALYSFIHENAHKYGFVISYPQGKENLTGYKYEPWHIRYVGKEVAAELFALNYLQTNNAVYLAQFLRAKGC